MRSIPGLIYHGTQSSTSSDLSPMSEQKSLPRRGRSRYHHLHLHNTNTTPRHKSSLSSSKTTTAQSPIASPRSSCINDTQTIQLPRMPSQFRPIHSSRTISNTPSRLSSDC
uniref:Down syndrome cell adhesion molecule-like protein Dscam2 n=2 Tax=Culex pipiens TaxID=7175 RepID=A0A8D8F3N2_CULPI